MCISCVLCVSEDGKAAGAGTVFICCCVSFADPPLSPAVSLTFAATLAKIVSARAREKKKVQCGEIFQGDKCGEREVGGK
jgi:hypothetical protein